MIGSVTGLYNEKQDNDCKTDFGSKVNTVAQRGARTHDPEIKSLMLYQLS